MLKLEVSEKAGALNDIARTLQGMERDRLKLPLQLQPRNM
jgi:hypothetical protein